jgi:hypothetical protein
MTLEPETLPVMTELADEEISELVGGKKIKSGNDNVVAGIGNNLQINTVVIIGDYNNVNTQNVNKGKGSQKIEDGYGGYGYYW